MENESNGNYGQKDHNPQHQGSQNYDSHNMDANEERNASDHSNSNSQRSPENGRDSSAPGSRSDSLNADQRDRQNESVFDDANDAALMPNPEDFDEGDYENTKDNERDATRTPGL